MTNVLILGAHGQIAQVATRAFLDQADVRLTLYLRNARRLQHLARNPRVRIVEGDVLDSAALDAAMAGQDVVYANLDGRMEEQAQNIVRSMKENGVRRLIFISSMGIYAEVPGERYRSILDPYRDSAALIEASGVDYTIVRPAWLNDRDEVVYGTTEKGQSFEAADKTVSRKSVADLVVKLATQPNFGVGQSLGVHRPG